MYAHAPDSVAVGRLQYQVYQDAHQRGRWAPRSNSLVAFHSARDQSLPPPPPPPPPRCRYVSLQNFFVGAAGTPFIRTTYAAFSDGKDAMAGPNRPNPRDISNKVSQSPIVIDSDRYLAPLVYIWGQVRTVLRALEHFSLIRAEPEVSVRMLSVSLFVGKLTWVQKGYMSVVGCQYVQCETQ